MDAYQSTARWLPILIQEVSGSSLVGIESILYSDAALAVKYKKNGGTVQTLTLTTGNWRESAKGIYEAYFTAAMLDTLGSFLYWATYTGAEDYMGCIDIVPALLTTAAIVTALSGVTVTVTSPTTTGGDVDLKQGADYAAGTTLLTWTVTGWATDISTDTATFRTAGFATGKTVAITNGETLTKTLTLALTRAEVFSIPKGVQEYEITFMTSGSLRRPETVTGNADVNSMTGITS